MIERQQSIKEEIANSLTHGLFFIAAIVYSSFLIAKSLETKDHLVIIASTVFVGSIITVYFISTLYHAMPRNRAKNILRLVDYGAVYFLIAGTYTPIALNVIKGKWGWVLFSLEWILASIGIIFLYYTGLKYKRLLVLFYLIMGWLVLIAMKPLWLTLPVWGIFWVFTGGLAYTIGICFYRYSYLNFRHFIWHIFTVAGTSCHSTAVFLYAV
ncbi:MAG: hemolysin III family protein [Candidatus Dadabacteria bacterium]|nr:hemolysin III family protein [Candidatus Dadabacteria bacterium]NIT13330.1 hemolysin III family protein [Candidatus Dadabacteria bacterium]